MSPEPIFRQRRLPHWDFPGAAYFVTGCLEGSIPARGLLTLREYRQELGSTPRPEGLTDDEWDTRKHKLLFARFDDIIDRQPGVRFLEDRRLAREVRESLYHFAGARYDLLAYIVMPSHFHWVFQPTAAFEDDAAASEGGRTARERIMHSIRSFTSNQCNRLLGREGAFWQEESYDHCVRDHDELLRVIEYVEMNPVKAGLVDEVGDWEFSSARDRARWDVAVGKPLVEGGG